MNCIRDQLWAMAGTSLSRNRIIILKIKKIGPVELRILKEISNWGSCIWVNTDFLKKWIFGRACRWLEKQCTRTSVDLVWNGRMDYKRDRWIAIWTGGIHVQVDGCRRLTYFYVGLMHRLVTSLSTKEWAIEKGIDWNKIGKTGYQLGYTLIRKDNIVIFTAFIFPLILRLMEKFSLPRECAGKWSFWIWRDKISTFTKLGWLLQWVTSKEFPVHKMCFAYVLTANFMKRKTMIFKLWREFPNA